MRAAGIVLIVLGLIGLIVFGVQAMNDSESFNFLGLEVAVSAANWTPVILSGLVTIVGLVLTLAAKKK